MTLKLKYKKIIYSSLILLAVFAGGLSASPSASALPSYGFASSHSDICPNDPAKYCTGDNKGKYACGQTDPEPSKDQSVKTSFNIGCKGVGNPITDATFAIIRFLSFGVGLVIVASLTFAGIQYTTSRGDPKATAEAIGRIKSNIIAFVLYLLAFAILNYIVPQGFIGL